MFGVDILRHASHRFYKRQTWEVTNKWINKRKSKNSSYLNLSQDFNSVSTRLESSSASRLSNYVHCTFINIFYIVVYQFFAQLYTKYSYQIQIICTVLWYKVFLSNPNNLHTVLWYQIFLSNTDDLHLVLYQVFLCNTNNFHTVIGFQVFLSNTNNLHSFTI